MMWIQTEDKSMGSYNKTHGQTSFTGLQVTSLTVISWKTASPNDNRGSDPNQRPSVKRIFTLVNS